MAKKSVLLVEDDEDILELLRYNLSEEGYIVDWGHLRRGGFADADQPSA